MKSSSKPSSMHSASGFDEWILRSKPARDGIFEEPEVEDVRLLVAEFESNRLEPGDLLSHQRKKTLNLIWEKWKNYAKCANCHPEQIWTDVCMGKDISAKPHFQAFLTWYTKRSTTWRPCLEAEEWKEVQTIKQASTVQDVWAALVKAADLNVISPLRKSDPSNSRWNLEYSSQRGGSRNATLIEIGQWICSAAGAMKLRLEQSFQKVEITIEDIMLLLHTFWSRSSDIPCAPKKRVGFHTAVLLLGLGGWRPGSIFSLKYSDVEIGRVRDPDNPEKAALVATITIHHVKQRVHIRRDQRNKLKFSITFVPCKSLCLLSFLLCKAFADDAFSEGFQTLDEVLPRNYQFRHQDVDYVPIPWRDDVLSNDIIPVEYKDFLKIWNLSLFVMGMRTHLRLYSLRVGTAGRLDGQLTPALRNYILSHSSAVYETSYHPVHVRENLMKISFGALAGQKDELLSQMRRACLRRDPGAPIYITKQDWDNFERRRDLTALRKMPSKSGAGPRIQYIKLSLEKLLIDSRRQEYFENVDRGRPVSHLVDPSATDPHNRLFKDSSTFAQQRVSPFFEDTATNADLLRELTRFLKGLLKEGMPESGILPNIQETVEPKPRCLLCLDARFHNPRSLSRHVWSHHDFDNQFRCPECWETRKDDITVQIGREAWSRHVEHYHDKLDVPNPASAKIAYCPFCAKHFTRQGFSLHFNRHQGDMVGDFLCPECRRKGQSSQVQGPDGWILHVRECHGGCRQVYGAVIAGGNDRNGVDSEVTKKRGSEQLEQEIVSYKQSRRWDGEDLDWKARAAQDHEGEEFYVTGRDEDYAY